MKKIQGKLTYANVVASLALFIAIGGASAFAANQLGKNSVGPKQLQKNAVTTAKIKANAVTGAKVKVATLGKVPSAQSADHASSADDAGKLGGVAAARYLTVGSKLGSGETEVGVFAASAGVGGVGQAAINFSPRLPGSVPSENAQILAPAATSAGCPGPRSAAPGFLCVYEVQIGGMTSPTFGSTIPDASSDVAEPEGAVIVFTGTAANGNARGSWAYTAR